MYLPLIAVLLLLVLFSTWLVERVSGRLLESVDRRVRSAIQVTLLLLACVPMALVTLQRNREYRTELSLAQTLVERWPTGVAHQIYGLALMRDGRGDQGLSHLQEAVELGNSRAGAALAGALLDAGQTEEALAEAEQFLASADPGTELPHRWLRPDAQQVVLALRTRAQILSRRQEWEAVEKDAQRALLLEPDNEDAAILLADALFEQQRWQDAQLAYRRYLRLRPTNVVAWVNLGIAEVGRERPIEAQKAFERAVEEAPSDSQARLFLSMILWQLGDLDGAAEHAAVARDLGVDDPVIQQILGKASRERPR